MGNKSSPNASDDSNLSVQLDFQQTVNNFFMQASGIFCVLKGTDYVFELANPSFLRFFGQRELIGKKLGVVMPELTKEVFESVLNKVYSTGVTHTDAAMRFLFSQPGSAPKEAFANLTFQPLQNVNEEVIGIIISGYEVTEQILARLKVEELEERMRLAVDISNIGIYDYNILTKEVVSSDIMNKILGINPGLPPDGYAEMIDEADILKLKEMFGKALETGQFDYQFRMRMNNGEQKWIQTTAKVFYNDGGQPVRMLGTLKDITESRVAEEKMATLAAIVESSEDLILSKGLDGIVTSWNAAGERIMGYKAEEMIGQHVSKLIPADRLQEEDEIISRLKKGERIEHFETERIRKDGRKIDISLTISPVKNPRGEIIGASKIARDITNQKSTKRQVSESEERLKIVLKASELGTWELNLKTGEIWASERYLQIFGYESVGDLMHDDFIRHLHPDDLPVREKAFKTATETGVLHYVSRLIRTDKIIRWFEARGTVLYNEANEPYKMLGTIRDMTTEMNYRRELETREQKFSLLADSMPQHIWTSDPQGNMSYFNQAMYDFSGMTKDQLGPQGWLGLLCAEEKETNRQLWLKAVKTGELFKMEHRFRRHDGQYRWQLSRALPQKDEDGNIVMWVGTSTDVHDWKIFTDQLEEQVKQRTKELQESNEELSKLNNELAQFAYVASHDLQEPLRKIQTFSARIQEIEKDRLSDKGKDYFMRLQNASRRMQQLILDLLAYSRANTAARHYEPVELASLTDGILEQLKDTIQQKNAVVEVLNMPTMHVVKYQFEQLFTNLLTNALKFSKTDEQPRISITCVVVPGSGISISGIDPKQSYYHFSITDNGIGFEPEYNEAIFQVFKRLHGKDEYPGTGIGLAIVKKIVENHTGFITASGESGKGARFDMYFPVGE